MNPVVPLRTRVRFPRHILIGVVLCAALGCSRAGSSPPGGGTAPKPVQLTAVVDGLSPQHLNEPPVVEKVSCPPRGSCLTSRVYRDGTLYYLVGAQDAAPGARWNPIGRISGEGVASLQKLYASLCGLEDPVLGNDSGSELHRVNVPGCKQEFVVTGIPSGKLAPIEEAQNIINRSMVRASSPASS